MTKRKDYTLKIASLTPKEEAKLNQLLQRFSLEIYKIAAAVSERAGLTLTSQRALHAEILMAAVSMLLEAHVKVRSKAAVDWAFACGLIEKEAYKSGKPT